MNYLPEKLGSRLMPFQRDGITYAISKNGRCLIGDEMGLGKTLQAISVAWYYKKEWPVLIIVPSSLKYPWIEEIEKWLPEIDPHQINLIQGGADVGEISSSLITLVTYGLLRHPASKVVREALTNQKFKVIIVDESHYMKNRKSATSKFLVPLIQKADRKLLLTGTPALARPEELFPQLSALLPKEFGQFGKFAKQYCDAHYQYYGKIRQWVTDGASNLEELQAILRDRVMIRRLKSDVLTQLPPKQRQRIAFEVKDSDLKKDLDGTWADLHKSLGKSNTTLIKAISSKSVGGEQQTGSDWFEVRKNISQLYHKTCAVKVGPVKDYLKMLCENRELKFIVFAYHHVMINSLVDQLMDDGVRFIRIDGTTLQQDRPRLVHQFQVEKSVRVAVLSIKAAGVGLTLTAASLVVFAELDWTPGALEQCEDRAHRIGQKDTVHVHYLVAKGTLDEWVWSALARKTTVVSTTLNGKRKVLEMDAGNQGLVNCLAKAEAYTPSQDPQQDSQHFFSSQLPSDQKTMLDFFTPGGSKKQVKAKTCRDLSIQPIIIDNSSDGEGNDSILEFKAKAKRKSRTKSSLADCEDLAKGNVKKKRKKSKISITDDITFDEDSHNISEPALITESNDSDVQEMLPDLLCSRRGKINKWQKDAPTLHTESNNDENSNPNETLPPKVDTSKPAIKETSTTELPCQTEHSEITCKDSRNEDTVESKETQTPLRSLAVTGTSSNNAKDSPSSQTDKSFDTKDQVRTVWSCSACTFDNHHELPYCEMCSTPQPKPKRPVRTPKESPSPIVRKVRRNRAKKTLLSPTTPPHTMDTGTSKEKDEADRRESCFVLDDNDDGATLTGGTGKKNISMYKKGKQMNLEEEITEYNSDAEIKVRKSEDFEDATSSGNNESVSKQNSKNGNEMEEEIVEYFSDIDLFDSSNKSSEIDQKDKQLSISCSEKQGDDRSPRDSCETSQKCSSSQVSFKTFNAGLNVISAKELKPTQISDQDMLPLSRVSNGHRKDHEISDKEDTTPRSSQNDLNSFYVTKSHDLSDGDTTPSCSQNTTSGKSVYDTADDMASPKSSQNVLKAIYQKRTHEMSDEETEDTTPVSSQAIVKTPQKSPKSLSRSLDDIMAEETEAAKILFSPKRDKKSGMKRCQGEDRGEDGSGCYEEVDGNDGEGCSDGDNGMAAADLCEWVCIECDMLNTAEVEDCDGCLASRPTQQQLGIADNTPVVKERQVNLDDIEVVDLFKYRCSQNTNRIYLYSQIECPLNVNFVPLDIEVGNYSELPDVLLHPSNLKLVQRFVREWNSLSLTKRRVVIRSGRIFSNPAIAYEESRSKSKVCSRHLTKEVVSAAAVSKAEEVGGTVRQVIRPKYSPKRKRKRSKSAEQQIPVVLESTDKGAGGSTLQEAKQDNNTVNTTDDSEIMTRLKGIVQAVDSEGRPLCVLCHKPYENELLRGTTIKENAWHTRFCTRQCMHQYWIKSSRSYGVDQIFAEEHGCCQLCSLEAHAFFLRIKGTSDLKKRARLIKDSTYNSLNSDFKEKMVKHPTKGLFWEVDHIIPVVEGGGECDVDNLRTLCTPCHRQVTAQQNRDRAKRRRLQEAAACGDITAFFRPK